MAVFLHSKRSRHARSQVFGQTGSSQCCQVRNAYLHQGCAIIPTLCFARYYQSWLEDASSVSESESSSDEATSEQDAQDSSRDTSSTTDNDTRAFRHWSVGSRCLHIAHPSYTRSAVTQVSNWACRPRMWTICRSSSRVKAKVRAATRALTPVAVRQRRRWVVPPPPLVSVDGACIQNVKRRVRRRRGKSDSTGSG